MLQALRLALMQHMFLRAVQIPAFSRANDISREDVMEMVFTLRIDDALAQLRRAFPGQFPLHHRLQRGRTQRLSR
jgi:phosphoenolpyruvate carboxylase